MSVDLVARLSEREADARRKATVAGRGKDFVEAAIQTGRAEAFREARDLAAPLQERSAA